jgi:uncharacterized protein (TIGR03083 family)
MTGRLDAELESYAAQAAVLADWLADLPVAAFGRSSALPDRNVRTLIAHLASTKERLAAWLVTRSAERALPVARYVRACPAAAPGISAQGVEVTDDSTRQRLIDRLRSPLADVEDLSDNTVLAGPHGPITALDFVRIRVLDLVVHCDDASRSLPDERPVPLLRPALATTTRLLAELLTTLAPGRSVEVRVPPFVAVQAVEGPRHTRGTPANVVETDPVTWLRVATGRTQFAAAVATGGIRASGTRADLTPYLPLLT